MTYCVGLLLKEALVFMADTRTNAGVDNIQTFRKLHTFEVPGDRALVILSAGNLATTQAVISTLFEREKSPEDRDPPILTAPSMFRVAKLVGETLRQEIQSTNGNGALADNGSFNATLIVGGQIKGGPMRLFMIYPEGNFVEAGPDTPFFQIGETKYGRPILVRAFDPEMSVPEAIKLLLVSFDSTVKANLAVAPPFDIQVIEKDALRLGPSWRIEPDDPYYTSLSVIWGDKLREAFESLPPFPG